jgi:ABC-2 type transport system permease protein
MKTIVSTSAINQVSEATIASRLSRTFATMRWLVKREFWENRSLFFWGPLGIALTLCSVFLAAAFKDSPWLMHTKILDNKKIMQDDPLAAANLIRDFIGTLGSELPIVLQMFYFWMLCIGGFVSILYLMSALHTERVDRSILFWKSLPISDSQTIVSKILFPLFLSPFILWATVTILFFVSVFIFGVVSEFTSVHLLSHLMGSLSLYGSSLQILALLPVFSLWALPSVGWYLMVSAWAKPRVFPWAIGIPILSIGLLLLLNDVFHLGWGIRWYSIHIVLRLIAGVFPASWLLEQQNIGLPEHYFSFQNVSEQALLAMQGASIWVGAVAGIVMLFVAVRLRQFNESNT